MYHRMYNKWNASPKVPTHQVLMPVGVLYALGGALIDQALLTLVLNGGEEDCGCLMMSRTTLFEIEYVQNPVYTKAI